MQRWRGLEAIPAGWGRCVVTIGVFDGLHRGHQALVAATVARARELGVPAVLTTFDPHPAEVVRAGSHPAQLTTLRRRAELAEQLGIDVFLVLPFTPTVQATPAAEFVHDVLVDRLHAAAVVIGGNFRFGHGGNGTFELLAELGPRFGFTVHPVDLVGSDQVTVTSTAVRALIAAGDMRAASAALGRPHRVDGFVVHGDGRGGTVLGYPTANLDTEPYAAIPADGIYAGWFVLGTRRLAAAISVGSNPTFSGQVTTVEAFVLDQDANFYGRRVALEFVEKLRDQRRYDDVSELIAQIGHDVEQTRALLADPTPTSDPTLAADPTPTSDPTLPPS